MTPIQIPRQAQGSTGYPERQPRQAWYVAATVEQVGRHLLPRRILEQPIVLFRTTSGEAVALEDRCAHRSYPLSLGTLEGDTVVAGFHGWTYDATGQCVRVPSQPAVPLNAAVRSYPVHEDSEFIWVWTGNPETARIRRPPAGWVSGPEWTITGGELDIAANATLILETLADATHIPWVDPSISPPALTKQAPDLQIELTELAVSFTRDYPPSPLAGWQASAIGLSADGNYAHHEAGELVGPGIWADRWDVTHEGAAHTLRFAQAVTPIQARTSHFQWRVASNSQLDETALRLVHETFASYYQRLKDVLEVVQKVRSRDGWRTEVNARADAAALHVRKIMQQLAAEDS